MYIMCATYSTWSKITFINLNFAREWRGGLAALGDNGSNMRQNAIDCIAVHAG